MADEANKLETQADEVLSGAVDATRPWTIKSVATETRDLAITAARKEGLTVGQWLERRMRQWSEEDGFAPHIPGHSASAIISAPVDHPRQTTLDAAEQAVGLLKQLLDIPGLPESVLRLAYTVLRERLRAAKS